MCVCIPASVQLYVCVSVCPIVCVSLCVSMYMYVRLCALLSTFCYLMSYLGLLFPSNKAPAVVLFLALKENPNFYNLGVTVIGNDIDICTILHRVFK